MWFRGKTSRTVVWESRRWLLLGKTFINLVKISKTVVQSLYRVIERSVTTRKLLFNKIYKSSVRTEGLWLGPPPIFLSSLSEELATEYQGPPSPASRRVLEQWMLEVSFSIALCCGHQLCGSSWVGVPAYPSPFHLGREGLWGAVVMRAGPPMPSSVLSSSSQRVVKTLLISKKLDNKQFLNS